MRVPSLEAEQAAALLMHELASYRRRARSDSLAQVGRILVGRAGSGSLPLPYSAVMTLITVTEGFFAAALQTRVESAFAVTTQIMLDAERSATKLVDANWPDRMKYARRWFSIDGSGESSVTDLLAFVQARNAIAHGVGRLTRRQRGDDEGRAVVTALTSVGVSVRGGLLSMDAVAVERCARSCRAAVLWLDEAVAAGALAPANATA